MQAWFEGLGSCDRIAKGNNLVCHNYCRDHSRKWQLLGANQRNTTPGTTKAIHDQDSLRVTLSQGSNAVTLESAGTL